MRPQIAVGKAWGALGMGFGSRTLARRVADDSRSSRRSSRPSTPCRTAAWCRPPAACSSAMRRGEILGAVGISGDTSDKDEACAVAGIAAARLVADPGA